jgi:ribosomal protein S18 acetylase RimI-like enzyme
VVSDADSTAGSTPIVTLRPMTAAEYEVWIEATTVLYAEERAAATGLPRDVSLEKARAQVATLLPDGHATTGMYLLLIVDDTGSEVGILWLGPHPDRPDTLYVWDISIDEPFRGRGFGRAAMLAAEDLARDARVDAIGLNVFGPNTAARRLYVSLGYDVTSQQMLKKL